MSDEELKAKLNANPGDPVFADLSKKLHASGDSKEALMVCFRGLSKNPNLLSGRLQLARIYIDLGFVDFALRELELIHLASPDNDSVKRLIELISPGSLEILKNKKGNVSNEKVLAEGSFKIRDIE